jgi:predicted dehydrogenase
MPPSFMRAHAECQYQFLQAISDDRPPAPSLEDGLRVQEVMEASLVASTEGRWVSVDEVNAGQGGDNRNVLVY